MDITRMGRDPLLRRSEEKDDCRRHARIKRMYPRNETNDLSLGQPIFLGWRRDVTRRNIKKKKKNGKQNKETHRPAAIPRFLEPFHTRSSQSTGTCRDPLSRPTSRKYVPWKPPLCERPFSMAGRPSASTTPPAEIHLRCTSEKQFREKGT